MYTFLDIKARPLCRKAVATIYCNVYTKHMWKDCIQEHPSDKTKVYSVVSRTQPMSTCMPYSMCFKHLTKQCDLQCERCDSLICTLCVASKKHKHHGVNDLVKLYGNQQEV